MQKNEKILKRQTTKIFFDNDDTDFFFNWMLGVAELFGMSHGELFYLAHKIGRDGKPHKWRSCFIEHADYLAQNAEEAAGSWMSANYYFGATYAYRSALQFVDPFAPKYSELVSAMESTFASATKSLNIPIKAVHIPYHNNYLSGYYLYCGDARPTVMMVGGGDTYREDLFYFAGWPGWQRNYNILMVDLPGQGSSPARGLTFTVDASEPIAACLDWLQSENLATQHIALYGVSGGGYFTAQAVEKDRRISAWVASTPIFDVAELFRREFGAALKAPSWLMKLAVKIAGNINEVADINLKKYAWQFGTSDFRSAIDEVSRQTKPVDHKAITCPSLLLMGEGEGAELQRQTRYLHDEFIRRNLDVTLHEFSAQSGADAHCQLNNLRLAHDVVFDWLDDRLIAHSTKS